MSPAVAGLERRASRAIHPPHVPPMQTHADITYGHGLCVCVNPRDKKGIEKSARQSPPRRRRRRRRSIFLFLNRYDSPPPSASVYIRLTKVTTAGLLPLHASRSHLIISKLNPAGAKWTDRGGQAEGGRSEAICYRPILILFSSSYNSR